MVTTLLDTCKDLFVPLDMEICRKKTLGVTCNPVEPQTVVLLILTHTDGSWRDVRGGKNTLSETKRKQKIALSIKCRTVNTYHSVRRGWRVLLACSQAASSKIVPKLDISFLKKKNISYEIFYVEQIAMPFGFF